MRGAMRSLIRVGRHAIPEPWREPIKSAFLDKILARSVSEYYPINPVHRWGYDAPLHRPIQGTLAAGRERYRGVLRSMAGRQDWLRTIRADADPESDEPCWNNGYLPPLDAAIMAEILFSRTPANFVEIGSGNSTRFARHIIDFGLMSTRLTSIDPTPRLDIDRLCDRSIRMPLEGLEPAELTSLLGPGDVLFFDGSHRVLTNSDVTVMFLDILPRLQAGVIVHVHDIFWPADYPPNWGRRLYSEQYLLGAMLLCGKLPFLVIIPNAYISRDAELHGLAESILAPFTQRGAAGGSSFWMEII